MNPGSSRPVDKDASVAVERFVDFYQTLTPASLQRIRGVYAEDAWFKDPFNDVHGADEVQRILAHMFDALTSARFVIRDTVVQGDSAFFTWDFTFHVKKWKPLVEQRIHGASHVRFDVEGKVSYHRDYWDAAEELYEKLPVIGWVMRGLKRRMR